MNADDEDPEDDLAESTDEPVEDPGGDHHRIDGQDGAQRDAFGRRRREEPLPAGCVRAHAAVAQLGRASR